MNTEAPPSLFQAWVEDIRLTWRLHKVHLLPWKLSACGGFAGVVAWNLQSAFFFPSNWSVAVAVYAGLLGFNALTMALAWSGIGRVYDSMSSPKFASFLKHTGVLNHYHFILGFIHTVQTFAACATIVSLSILLIGRVPVYVDRLAFAATLALTLYALWWAYSAARVARDLSWHHATFDGLDDTEIESIRLAVDNTTKP